MSKFRPLILAAVLAATVPALTAPTLANAASAAEIRSDSDAALAQLYAKNPSAKLLGRHAKAILIFPRIVKAGLVIGGAYGEGELKQGGKVAGYYSSVTASWGLQAGAQSYGYALFLMNQKAVDYLHESKGWEIGTGPTVVIVKEGVARSLTTSTLKDDAYAFIFDQAGLMAGVSLEGAKISKIKP